MREKEFLPLISTRLGIENLNEMQRRMMQIASDKNDVVLLSPTGSGKTLAFILPMLKLLKPSSGRVQSVVIAPSRELVVQIYTIIRTLASGYKTTALYGGHKIEDEQNSLSVVPDIVVATPGRLLDHINRRNIDLLPNRILILDEFDKTLELGFEDEMRRIVKHLKNVSRTIMTSATAIEKMPDFLSLNTPITLSYLADNAELEKRIAIYRVDADGKDKLNTLLQLLATIADGKTIKRTMIFVNHRESAIRVADFLKRHQADVSLYHGALEQKDREQALSLFANGTSNILVTTDLASRGLDIDEVASIIHYHQPLSAETYTHRNGRTARQDAEGCVYVIVAPEEKTADFIEFDNSLKLIAEVDNLDTNIFRTEWTTLRFSAGRREKISRGDLVGFLTNQGELLADDIGRIDLSDHYTLIAVRNKKVTAKWLDKINLLKIKGTRRRVIELRR